MESYSVSEFKAKCLAIIEHVRTSGRKVVLTKNGEPAIDLTPHREGVTWIPGRCAHTVTHIGDVEASTEGLAEWSLEP